MTVGLWAETRTLTSADGEKTIEAEILRYSRDTGMVTLRLSNGKRMVTPSSHFSEADQEFFKQMAKSKAIADAVEVDFRTRPKQKLLEKNTKDKIDIEKRFYENAIVVENTSEYALKNVTVRYWLLLERFNDKGKEYLEVLDGSVLIPDLQPEKEKEVSGPSITLVQGAVPNCKPDCGQCNKALNAASLVQRERVHGHKVEILNADGKVIASDVSSKRVEDYLVKTKPAEKPKVAPE